MDEIKLSKELAYALRHAPHEYNLKLDPEGWVYIDDLIEGLKNKKSFSNVTKEDFIRVIDNSEKKRYEIVENKIRAIYGHSVKEKIKKTPSVPPEILYHGTAKRFMESIYAKGLLSNGRQYVHLSEDIKTAYEVGKRHDSKPIILKIKAKMAHDNGIVFYFANDKIWLSETIPPEFFEVS